MRRKSLIHRDEDETLVQTIGKVKFMKNVFKTFVPPSQKLNCTSITHIRRLVMWRDTIQSTLMYTLWEIAEFFNVKAGVIYTYHRN